MTHASHVTHARTTERLDRIRKLIAALQDRDLRHENIADLLKLSPSGTRKYVADLRKSGVMEIARYADGTATFLGYAEYRLALGADEAREYLANLAAAPASGRKGRISELALAERDPKRHLHIMLDDEYHQVRVFRGIPAHEPVHAAFWRMGGGEQRV